MLVQRARLEVPGLDAHVSHVSLRQPDFGVLLMWSRGIVIDWGIQSELVAYIARQVRSQLSILLAGRGYFEWAGGPLVLGPGDVIESDQRRHGMEGYAGSPCAVLVIDWEDEASFGRGCRGAPRHARIGARDLVALRELAARIETTPPLEWVGLLRRRLRALGLPIGNGELPRAPRSHAAKLYAALGEIRSQLHDQPALPEIATALGLSERQVRRCFTDLGRDFGLTTESWRDFMSDARLASAQQLLSVPGVSIARAAELAGFGSQIALTHAFSLRGRTTPGEVARRLRERWG